MTHIGNPGVSRTSVEFFVDFLKKADKTLLTTIQYFDPPPSVVQGWLSDVLLDSKISEGWDIYILPREQPVEVFSGGGMRSLTESTLFAIRKEYKVS